MVKLSQLENELNDYFKYGDEYMTFRLLQLKDNVVMQIYDGDTEELLNGYNTNKDAETMEQVIKDLIYQVYETDVNWRNKFINGWKAYSKRKVKSLMAQSSRCNQEKVTAINKELIDRYKTTEDYKIDVSGYKQIISALYNAKENLCGESEIA